MQLEAMRYHHEFHSKGKQKPINLKGFREHKLIEHANKTINQVKVMLFTVNKLASITC